MPKEKIFTRYQIFMIAILAILQFIIIVDFMVISPLGVILLKQLNITTSDFGVVVSAYAFSAGLSGLLSAGFADKFDRKKLLLFFFVGFLLGTTLCGLATSYTFLLVGRIVTGLFGGVIGSVSFAIITDLFELQVRGRVMGYVQMAFAASRVLGLPIGIYLATAYGWHSPFWMILGLGIVVVAVIMFYMKPVTEHLHIQRNRSPLQHLVHTLTTPRYLFGFMAMSLLATGGFMLMPFASTFTTHNMGILLTQLPELYIVTGLFSIIAGPLAGKMSDKIGKMKVFAWTSVLAAIVIGVYCHLGLTSFWFACAISAALFILITARGIPASALLTAIPDAEDRGAFMSINSATMQIAGGIASVIAGQIVIQEPSGLLEHYDILGYVVMGSMLLMIWMLSRIDRSIKQRGIEASPKSGFEPVPQELPTTEGELLAEA